MGDLKFSKVIIAIQNYLYNWGTQAYFCLKVKNFAQVSMLKHFRLHSKGDEKNYFVIFSIILPVIYIHGIKPLNNMFCSLSG